MINNKYIQEIYQLEIQHISNQFFIDRCCTKGSSYIDKGILIAKTEYVLTHNENFQAKEFKVKQMIENIRSDYQEYSDIMIYYKFRKERIWINNERDQRDYEYIRLVYRDENDHLLLEERVVNEEHEMHLVVEEALKHMINNINKVTIKEIQKTKLDGNYSVVIPTSLTGLFIHEIIGHLLENDFFEHPLTMINYETCCSKILNVSDIALGNMNINKIDDIGGHCIDTPLIKNGKIINCLSEKTGNKRREDYRHKPITRMRTTYVHPYSDKNELDYINGLESGIFLENIIMGNVNPLDGSYFLDGYGYNIKDGRKNGLIIKLRIEGNIIEDLLKIADIGNDVKLRGIECFKKSQFVRVASLSPSMLLNDMKVIGEMYEC